MRGACAVFLFCLAHLPIKFAHFVLLGPLTFVLLGISLFLLGNVAVFCFLFLFFSDADAELVVDDCLISGDPRI